MKNQASLKAPSKSLIRLRQSARTLFVNQGYHDTRPQDIARHADCANGTFYMYFKDKKAAYLDFAEQAQSELIAKLEADLAAVNTSISRWRVVLTCIIHFGHANPGLLSAAFLDPITIAPDDEKAQRLSHRLGNLVEMVLKSDAVQSAQTYHLELISHGICGMLRHAMIYSNQHHIPINKLIDDLCFFIEGGFGLHSTENNSNKH